MTCIKYLGVLIDSNLNWKEHILNMSKNITKSIGIICKLRHFVNTQTLVQLFYEIVYPFLTYGCMVWGSTYCSNIKPLEILQKRTIRIISFAKFYEHSTPLFAKLKIIKLHDTILLYAACFMYQYSNCNLPSAFDSFFTAINTITVLAWHQNPHLLFQKLERIMENLISDILVQKSGTRLKSS